jgi:hypothetical protein
MELFLIFLYFDALEYLFQLNEVSHSKTALWPLTLALSPDVSSTVSIAESLLLL